MTTTSPTAAPTNERPPGDTAGTSARAPFTPPRLEALGPWRALTLQQSIPIGPSGLLRGRY